MAGLLVVGNVGSSRFKVHVVGDPGRQERVSYSIGITVISDYFGRVCEGTRAFDLLIGATEPLALE